MVIILLFSEPVKVFFSFSELLEDDLMESMYDRIAAVCKARGITPSGLCVKLGIRKAIMSDLKSGKSATIRTTTVVEFAEALGVSTDYLLTGRETALIPIESQLLAAWRVAPDNIKENVAFALREYGMPMPEIEKPSQQEAV